jgi:hypothetical protein
MLNAIMTSKSRHGPTLNRTIQTLRDCYEINKSNSSSNLI